VYERNLHVTADIISRADSELQHNYWNTMQSTSTTCHRDSEVAGYIHNCNLLQSTATYFNLLQPTATYCNPLQLTATHWNLLQPTGTSCHDAQIWRCMCVYLIDHTCICNRSTHVYLIGEDFFVLQHTVTHCNTLQHTATHCNTLQHHLQRHL